MRRFAVLALVVLAALAAACGGQSGTEVGGPAGSRLYSMRDPHVRIAVDPRWTRAGEGSWVIDRSRADYLDNVSVQGEILPREVDLDTYVERGVERSRRAVSGLVVDRRERLRLASGLEAERVVYHGGRGGQVGFSSLTTIRGQSAATVVVTAPVSRLEEVVASIDPYLRTLTLG